MKLLTLIAALFLTGCYAPHEATAATPPNTIIVGDSITCMGQEAVKRMYPAWRATFDCVPGRKVATLHYRIKQDLKTYGTPKRMVLALGQNESEGWTRADYAHAVDLIPSSVEVIFVTTYRDPVIFGEERAAVQAQYSSWMRSIDHNRERVTVADWRSKVISGEVVLVDGSHPDELGKMQWASMVRKAVRAV